MFDYFESTVMQTSSSMALWQFHKAVRLWLFGKAANDSSYSALIDV